MAPGPWTETGGNPEYCLQTSFVGDLVESRAHDWDNAMCGTFLAEVKEERVVGKTKHLRLQVHLFDFLPSHIARKLPD